MFPEGDLGPNRALVNGKQGSSAYVQCLWINTPRSLEIVQTDGDKRQLFEGYAWGMGPKFQDLLVPLHSGPLGYRRQRSLYSRNRRLLIGGSAY